MICLCPGLPFPPSHCVLATSTSLSRHQTLGLVLPLHAVFSALGSFTAHSPPSDLCSNNSISARSSLLSTDCVLGTVVCTQHTAVNDRHKSLPSRSSKSIRTTDLINHRCCFFFFFFKQRIVLEIVWKLISFPARFTSSWRAVVKITHSNEWRCHSPAVCPWTSYLTSPSLSCPHLCNGNCMSKHTKAALANKQTW